MRWHKGRLLGICEQQTAQEPREEGAGSEVVEVRGRSGTGEMEMQGRAMRLGLGGHGATA